MEVVTEVASVSERTEINLARWTAHLTLS